MFFNVGDKFRLLSDMVDDDDGVERRTPAGSVIEVDAVYPKITPPGEKFYAAGCHETGGWGFFDHHELAQLPKVEG